MTKNLKFHVTGNGLHRDDDIKYLSATNGIYNINIFYYGDYDADLVADKIDYTATLVTCESDGLRPELKCVVGQIYVGITHGELLYIHRVDEYKQQLDDAKQSAIALAELLKAYGFKGELSPK